MSEWLEGDPDILAGEVNINDNPYFYQVSLLLLSSFICKTIFLGAMFRFVIALNVFIYSFSSVKGSILTLQWEVPLIRLTGFLKVIFMIKSGVESLSRGVKIGKTKP